MSERNKICVSAFLTIIKLISILRSEISCMASNNTKYYSRRVLQASIYQRLSILKYIVHSKFLSFANKNYCSDNLRVKRYLHPLHTSLIYHMKVKVS